MDLPEGAPVTRPGGVDEDRRDHPDGQRRLARRAATAAGGHATDPADAPPEKLDEQTAKLVDVVQGDQLDKDDVLRATEGADALYWVDPPGGEDPIATYALAGSHAAAAIREHGITRTVFQRSVGAEKRVGAGEIDGLARTEELLDAIPRR